MNKRLLIFIIILVLGILMIAEAFVGYLKNQVNVVSLILGPILVIFALYKILKK